MHQLPLVTDATAWKGADYANDTSWIYTLSAPEVEELARPRSQCLGRGLEVTDIEAGDFPLAQLAPTIAGWAEEINNGRGFLLVKGLPRERFSDDEVRAMFWGIGLYLGVPVSQNSYGDMLGDVYDEGVKLGTGASEAIAPTSFSGSTATAATWWGCSACARRGRRALAASSAARACGTRSCRTSPNT